MNIEKFREIIKEREYVDTISCGEWSEKIEECQKQEKEILIEDISSTILFLKNDCTAEEYSWISEIIEDIAEATKSEELVKAYKELLLKYPEESAKYHIAERTEYLDELING